MNRREFITLLGGAAVVAAWGVGAQPSEIAYHRISGATTPSAQIPKRLTVFVQLIA